MSDVEDWKEAAELNREGEQEACGRQDRDDGGEKCGHEQATDEPSPGRDKGTDWRGRQGHDRRRNSADVRAATMLEEGPWQNGQRHVGPGAEYEDGAKLQRCRGDAHRVGQRVDIKDLGLSPGQVATDD